jgi:hypothetical protein
MDRLGLLLPRMFHRRTRQKCYDAFLVRDNRWGLLIGDVAGKDPSTAHCSRSKTASSVHRVFSAHPELAQIATTQPIDGLAAYRGAEVVLAALRQAGFGDEEAVAAFDALVCYTAGFTRHQVALETV